MQVRIPQLFEEIAANKPHGCKLIEGTTATRAMITFSAALCVSLRSLR